MERTIDDRDPTILYSIAPSGSSSADWDPSFGGPFEHNGTTTLSQRLGASFTFTFSGTAVAVYGTISVNDTILPSSSYTLDGGAPVFYTPPRATGADLLSDAHRTLFFQAGGLERGTHRLVVRNEVDGDRYWLDYLTYVPTPAESTSVSSGAGTRTVTSTATSTGIGTGAGDGDGTGSGTGSQTQTQTQDQGEKTTNNTAAIAGGAVGGALLLLALIGAFFLWRRRDRRKHAQPPAGSRVNLNDPAPGMVERNISTSTSNGYHPNPHPYYPRPSAQQQQQQPTAITAQRQRPSGSAPLGPFHVTNPSLDGSASVTPFSIGSSASDSGNASGTGSGSVSQPSQWTSNSGTTGTGAPLPNKLLRDGYAPVNRRSIDRTSGAQPPAYQAS